MNFLINIRVFIKTLNELLLIHLIGSDHVKYEYFSMLGSDMERFFHFDSDPKRSYYESRYKMIEGDVEFNSEQKKRIEFLLSRNTNNNMGYATYGGCTVGGGAVRGGSNNTSNAVGYNSIVIGNPGTSATGGSQVLVPPGTYNVVSTSTTTKTTIPIK
jgi:hypothetical protein